MTTTLGLMIDQSWRDDPKRLAFTFSRYKFVAKMLSGSRHVLEVGCGDGFASRVVQQAVERLSLCDRNAAYVDDIKSRLDPAWPLAEVFQHDMVGGPVGSGFDRSYDGVYALDVLEHIAPEDEAAFLGNMVGSLNYYGVMVLGMPSLESQVYASPLSKEGHVNCQSLETLKGKVGGYFRHVFGFSMNDEVVHTGDSRMAHYIFVVCCGKIGGGGGGVAWR